MCRRSTERAYGLHWYVRFYSLGGPKSLGSCTSMVLVFLRSSSLSLSLRWSAAVRSRLVLRVYVRH